MSKLRVAVLGAGPTGLAAAHQASLDRGISESIELARRMACSIQP